MDALTLLVIWFVFLWWANKNGIKAF